MSTDDRDDLVGDVADALTLDQQVPWERCARLAAGADREQIENLRVIARVLASRPAGGPASEAAEATRPYGRAIVRHAVHHGSGVVGERVSVGSKLECHPSRRRVSTAAGTSPDHPSERH